VLTKGCLQLSPEAAMLPGPRSTEPKYQGHCWKWHHKLKVVWHQYASIAYNRLKLDGGLCRHWRLKGLACPLHDFELLPSCAERLFKGNLVTVYTRVPGMS